MKNWEMTKRQYLTQKYWYMRERVTGVATNSSSNYLGLPICSKEEFVQFGMKDKTFDRLFRAYKRSKGARMKAPSVDRKNNKRGYVIGNMQFLTVPDNSRKELFVALEDSKTGRVRRFPSTSRAASFLGHKTRIKLDRKRFVSMNNGRVFFNRSKKI